MKPTVGRASFTTWLSATELLAVNPLPVAGVNAAVMLWVPATNVLEVKTAVPLFNVTAEPTGLPSKLNSTVPVGTVEPLAGVTVAVIVTGCPYEVGFNEDASVVAVPIVSPVPLSEMLCVAEATFSELSVSTNDSVKVPVVVGANSMLRLQLAPAAKEKLAVQSGGVPLPAT